MIYDIRHLTTYSYAMPVAVAACTLRLMPRSSKTQHVIASEVEIVPAASHRLERESFEGNRTTVLWIETPHREMRIDARSRVEVCRALLPAMPSELAWEVVRDEAMRTTNASPSSPVHYLFPSRLVSLNESITGYSRTSFPPGRDILEGAADLMRRIKSDFAYDQKATEVSTPLLDAFEQRRGVCQDFAQIMIAGLRGLGLPTAYVSGYLRTRPAPGRARLEGADATHAWIDLWCGRDLGWVGFDPTNALFVTDEHVVLAVGRDYTDVSPINGIIRGSGLHELTVAVDVVALE